VLKPPRAERLSLEGPAGALQALIEFPADEAVAAPRGFAVVCHPHPLYGGTLDNKVVYTLARSFVELGSPAIRFNFRGVGASAGVYDSGRGETGDALAVIAFGRQRWPGAALWLAGFSFGGAVAVRAAGEGEPQRLIAVAPGVLTVPVTASSRPACPWLIVQGDADDVVPPGPVRAWAGPLGPLVRLEMLPGAGHFFHGRLHDLKKVVLGFMQPGAPPGERP
jgi:alpha/beta superfamily hydrolase